MTGKLVTLVLAGLLLGACTQPIYMKNLQTGEVVDCNKWQPQTAAAATVAARGCINDYKEQGYIRVPHK